jgi:hypothetical protein
MPSNLEVEIKRQIKRRTPLVSLPCSREDGFKKGVPPERKTSLPGANSKIKSVFKKECGVFTICTENG